MLRPMIKTGFVTRLDLECFTSYKITRLQALANNNVIIDYFGRFWCKSIQLKYLFIDTVGVTAAY